MHRNARQQKILELIASKEIDTQEELCYELNKLNFNVTQATISRDIKELKLYKISGTTKNTDTHVLSTATKQSTAR